MKKRIFLSVVCAACAASLAFLPSCGKKEEPAPDLSDYGSMTVTTGLAKVIEDRYYDKYAVGLRQALADDHFDV